MSYFHLLFMTQIAHKRYQYMLGSNALLLRRKSLTSQTYFMNICYISTSSRLYLPHPPLRTIHQTEQGTQFPFTYYNLSLKCRQARHGVRGSTPTQTKTKEDLGDGGEVYVSPSTYSTHTNRHVDDAGFIDPS